MVQKLQLTKLREERCWTRAELARRTRMSPGDVGKIEAKRLTPYPSQLRKLARALGLPIADAASLIDVAAAETAPEAADRLAPPERPR